MTVEVMVINAQHMLAAGMLAFSPLARRCGWLDHSTFLIQYARDQGRIAPRHRAKKLFLALLGLFDLLVFLSLALVSHVSNLLPIVSG